MSRAVSPALGFVVVFATVLLSVGVVTAGGYAALDDARETQRVDNGVRAFEVLATNTDAVVEDGAPSRATTVSVDGSQVVVADPVTVEVHVPADGFERTVTVRPITYDTDDARVAYTSGAVVRADRGGAVVVRPPQLVVTAESAVIPVVRTYPVDTVSAGGQGSVRVRTTATGTTVDRTATDGDTVYLNVTSPRSEAWYRYLDDQSRISCMRTGSTVSCTVDTDHVAVPVTDVAVRLDG